jgi:glycosyltransferase involved in cell wall biosynthesis
MRLMLMLEDYPPDVTAPAVRMHNLVDVISERTEVNARIVVYSSRSTSKKMKAVKRITNNVSVVRYDLKYLPQLLGKLPQDNPLAILITTLIAIREVRNYKPDLILTTVPTYNPTIAIYLASLLLGNQFCIDIRDDWTNKRIAKWAIRNYPWYSRLIKALTSGLAYTLFIKACQKAFLLTSVYDSLVKDLQRLTNLEKPVVVVPNGINLSELEAVRQTSDKCAILHKYGIPIDDGLKYVIYVGTIRDYHKPEILIKPLQDLIREGKKMCFIIIGEGDSDIITKEIEANGDPKNDIFLRKVAHSDVLELLLASDVGFYALSRGFPVESMLGVKILEYVGCKLPILAVADEYILTTKFIKAHGIGIALGWDETSLIRSSIEKLIQDPQFANNIDAYYPTFVKEFERKTNSEKLYEAILQNYQRVAR